MSEYFGLDYYNNGSVYWGIFLDYSDENNTCGPLFDPDIAGIGVSGILRLSRIITEAHFAGCLLFRGVRFLDHRSICLRCNTG